MKIEHAFASVCICLAFLSCTKVSDPVKVTGISLNTTSLTLTEGDMQTLSATISPNNADNKMVIWSTSDISVATVDNNGLVQGVATGTATITAKSDDGGKTATCSVTVTPVSVVSVSLDRQTLELTIGGTATLTPTINPSNATDKSVSWSSSDAAVATVSGGKVTAIEEGTCTITVKTNDGGKTATCSVKVSGSNLENISDGGEWEWDKLH